MGPHTRFLNLSHMYIVNTVKPVLSSHSKIDKTKTLMTNGSLMKVKSIAESILKTKFWCSLCVAA